MIKLFRFLKPYWLFIVVVLILTLIQSLSQLYLPTLMANIVDTGIVSGDTGYILRLGGLMLLVATGGGLCIAGASFFAARVGAGFGRDVRKRLFTHVESFSLHEFDTVGTASLITRTTNDITQVQQVTVMMLVMMAMAPMMAIGGIIMALRKDQRLSLLIVVVVPVLALVIVLIASAAIPLFKTMQVKLDNLNRVLRERLTGVRVIRAFNRIDHEKARFNAVNIDLTSTAIKVNRIVAVAMPIMMLAMNLTTVAIIWFGSKRIDTGAMQVGDLMAFVQYVMQIMFSLLMVTMMFIMVPRASVSAVRINQVLDIKPEIVDAGQVKPAGRKRGFLEFRNVSFNYPGAEEAAIKEISFAAGPGETTAIIGGTGSGKTTLVNLILRFYDVDNGSVLVDGTDVRELSQEELREKIGFVPQKAVLFSGTISENIRYGKDDATDEEVARATKTAQAKDFVTAMDDGFDSVIAQDGTNISGGQKQRLSIARALVRKPEIYIFDDSFSALDFKTDANLREALKKETSESTVLIVAQRVTTVMDADRIIVLDDGKISGMGTHRELMEESAVYREIVYSQLSAEEIA
ncbi:MAG TPA: ABC transporter ATP-binding protein [bacterium]|nr:ABC transporter ATP-binding protein [bacterium]